ncbi:hypothetical protein, partial [Klebsiella pneumoniae]|uniref:hypothetical protein n=1 Tax=Klebsiella pneumoniae TaxID=573 RepID=UPI0019545993
WESAAFQPIFWLSPCGEMTSGDQNTEVQPAVMATGASPSAVAIAYAGFVIIMLCWIILAQKAYIRSK